MGERFFSVWLRGFGGFGLAAFALIRPAMASDISEALTFAQRVMGNGVVDGYEEIVDDDPDEALALLLSPVIEPNRPPSAYGPRTTGKAARVGHHFARLGDERLSFDRLRPFIEAAADETRLPVALIDAVIRTESGYRPRAVSRAGAIGLMQLLPATAKGLGVDDPFDPRANIMAGALYLRRQYDRFGSLTLALAAYNAGPGAVDRAGGVPKNQETERYVAAVLQRFRGSPLR